MDTLSVVLDHFREFHSASCQCIVCRFEILLVREGLMRTVIESPCECHGEQAAKVSEAGPRGSFVRVIATPRARTQPMHLASINRIKP